MKLLNDRVSHDSFSGSSTSLSRCRGPFPMVQTVLRTLPIPQLQFVARWSMSSSCWSCAGTTCAFLGQGYGRARCVQRQVLAVTVLRTVEVSAVAVHRPACQTSTEAYGRIFHIFYVTVNLDPEVDSLLAVEIWISTSPCIWQSLRVHTSAT